MLRSAIVSDTGIKRCNATRFRPLTATIVICVVDQMEMLVFH